MKCTKMERWFKYQNWYIVPKENIGKSVYAVVLKIAVIITSLILICSLLYKCIQTEPYRSTLTHYDALQIFFTFHGSPTPSLMADAVSQTKHPALMAALMHLEHNARVSGAEMGLALEVANDAIAKAVGHNDKTQPTSAAR